MGEKKIKKLCLTFPSIQTNDIAHSAIDTEPTEHSHGHPRRARGPQGAMVSGDGASPLGAVTPPTIAPAQSETMAGMTAVEQQRGGS